MDKITAVLVTIPMILMAANLPAGQGDTLVVSGSLVNVRDTPSMDGKILKRFAEGKQLIEISRYGEWVEITTESDEISSGWVHASLLEPLQGTGQDGKDKEGFNAFKIRYETLLERARSERGMKLFSRVILVDDHSIQLVAESDWFSLTRADQEGLLSEIFDLWRQHIETGYSVMVEVVDRENEQHMIMFK